MQTKVNLIFLFFISVATASNVPNSELNSLQKTVSAVQETNLKLQETNVDLRKSISSFNERLSSYEAERENLTNIIAQFGRLNGNF